MKKERDRYVRVKSCSSCIARYGDHCKMKVGLFIPAEVINGVIRYPDGCPLKHIPRPCPKNDQPLYVFEG